MNTLNKDQLALLNGSNDIEELSLEEMHNVAGGQACPYGQRVIGAIFISGPPANCGAYGGSCVPVVQIYCG